MPSKSIYPPGASVECLFFFFLNSSAAKCIHGSSINNFKINCKLNFKKRETLQLGIFRYFLSMTPYTFCSAEVLSRTAVREQKLQKNPNKDNFIYEHPFTIAIRNSSHFIFLLFIIIVNIRSSSRWSWRKSTKHWEQDKAIQHQSLVLLTA